jgi:hypothetical protein
MLRPMTGIRTRWAYALLFLPAAVAGCSRDPAAPAPSASQAAVATSAAPSAAASGTPAGPAGGVKVGEVAPEFSLMGSDGKTHKLSDHRGKEAVVVAWFPKAFTGG